MGRTSRSLNGSAVNVSRVKTWPTAPVPTRSVAASAVTTTCSENGPGSSVNGSVAWTPDVSRISRMTSVLNPVRLAVRVNVPAGSAVNTA